MDCAAGNRKMLPFPVLRCVPLNRFTGRTTFVYARPMRSATMQVLCNFLAVCSLSDTPVQIIVNSRGSTADSFTKVWNEVNPRLFALCNSQNPDDKLAGVTGIGIVFYVFLFAGTPCAQSVIFRQTHRAAPARRPLACGQACSFCSACASVRPSSHVFSGQGLRCVFDLPLLGCPFC
jgi:hypothetical protein